MNTEPGRESTTFTGAPQCETPSKWQQKRNVGRGARDGLVEMHMRAWLGWDAAMLVRRVGVEKAEETAVFLLLFEFCGCYSNTNPGKGKHDHNNQPATAIGGSDKTEARREIGSNS